jgi:hypothetical protein
MIYEIETEEDYQEGLKRFLEICGKTKNEEEEKELFMLIRLMEKYERNNCSST